jgi:glycosyltransferase involved in cell wall biosynthesis
VHIHGWSKALSGSVCAAALARRAPVVVSLHDYFAACPNGGFYQYPQQRPCTLTAMSPSCIVCNCDGRSYPQKLYRVARQAVQQQAGRLPGGVRHFIHHSQLVRKILTPYLPPRAIFHAVPMAVDVTIAPPTPVALNGDFVSVGRLSPEKGSILFAQAAAVAGIRPVFVGEGREREAVLNAAPDAEVTGWKKRAGVMARLAKARALVSPALSYETFGLTVAEALAQGVPAIVADRSAAAELVQDGETGLLFRTGDAASLASRLEILKDSDRAATMGRRAYEHYWQSPLSAERHLAAMLAVYERICA